MGRIRKADIIDIREVEKYYTITDDGRVFSKIKNRWLKPRYNIYGYIFYSISKGVPCALGAFAHTLVALKYIGKPPTTKHEIDHIDDDKANNYYMNLRWVTHSQNQLKAYANGRVHYWLGRKKGPPSLVTKMKMADAKKKRVLWHGQEGDVVFESIEDAAIGLGTYRKKIYLSIKNGREMDGGVLSIVDDVI